MEYRAGGGIFCVGRGYFCVGYGAGDGVSIFVWGMGHGMGYFCSFNISSICFIQTITRAKPQYS